MRISPSQLEDRQRGECGRMAGANFDAPSCNANSGPPSVEVARSAADRGRARAQFNEAMESIPHDDRAAYMEAMRRAPRLVEIESNPDHYIDHAELDPWKSAARVAAYWETRVELFTDRAFLPLTISGEGAMSPEDVELLRSGVFMVLPNDSQGRPVFLHDRARLPMNAVPEGMCRHRCLFYILYALSSREANRKNGFIIVSPLVKTTRKTTLENGYNARAMKLIQDEVFPIRYVETHIVILSTRSVFTAFTTFFLQLALRFGISKSRITIHNHAHSASAADDALRDLQDHGFRVEGIPAVPFGGMFTIGCFREWLADRQRLEHILHDPNGNQGAASSFSASSEKVQIHDTETRKRRADASYCRKKRFLKKIEIEGTQEEVERLRQQNQRLKEEEARLQDCLLRAQKFVDDHARGRPRVRTSAPLLEVRERPSLQGIWRALVGSPSVASPAPVVAAGALNQSMPPFSDPRLVGRNSSNVLEWSDRHISLSLASLSSTLSAAPVPVQTFPSVRPSLPSVPPPSRYYNDQQLLQTLVGTTTTPAPAATDPLLALVLAQALHAEPTAHVDRSRQLPLQARTDRREEDLRQLLVQQLLRERFSPHQRGRDA